MSNVETTTLRAVLKDELSRPARRLRGEVDSTTNSLRRLARTDASTPLGRLSRTVGTTGLALHRADPHLQRFSNWLNGGIARGTKIAAAGLLALTLAVTTFGVRSSSQFEQARISFDGFLGSAQAGEQLFSHLQALNLKTPFQLGAITGGAKQLLGFGFVDQVEPLLKSATDVAAGLGGTPEVLDRILLNLGQVRSQGKVTGRELRDFAVLGVPGYELTANILGKSRAEIQAMGDDAQVSGDKFIEAFIGMQGPLGRFAGMAERQMNSLTGLWSNFMDVLNVRLADDANPLTLQLKESLPQLTAGIGALLDTAGPPLFALVGLIADGVVRLLPLAEPLLNAIFHGFEDIAKVAGGPLLTALQPVAGELGLAITDFFEALVPVLPDLVDLLVALVLVLPDFVRLLGDIIPLADPILRFITGLLELGPVRDLAAAALGVFVGYKILGPLASMGFDFAASLLRIAAGQEAVAAAGTTGAVGTAGAGGLGKGGAALGLGIPGVMLAASGTAGNGLGSDLSTIGGFGLTGAAIGSILPGVGTLIGGGVGAGVGGLVVGAKHLFGGDNNSGPSDEELAARAARTDAFNRQYGLGAYAGANGRTVTNQWGDVYISNPATDLDIQRGLETAMDVVDRERYERGGSR